MFPKSVCSVPIENVLDCRNKGRTFIAIAVNNDEIKDIFIDCFDSVNIC